MYLEKIDENEIKFKEMQVFVLRKLSKQTIMGMVLLLKCLLDYRGTQSVSLFRGRPTSGQIFVNFLKKELRIKFSGIFDYFSRTYKITKF